MSKLLLSFYGDDFTGSTDALEQLTLAGVRAVLFTAPPTARQLARFKGLQAVGVAGLTRSLPPAALERELRPALRKLKALGARHVHYKVCSTFDSSPEIGSIGRVIDIAAEIFRAPFVPVLAAAPALGRYTIFGNHFARYGIGSSGAIHRLDRHPSISRHPVTPMTEADLAVHLGRQTRKRIALFDVLQVALPSKEARTALQKLIAAKAEIVLFDALTGEHVQRIGDLLDGYARARRPLFSVGSSAIEMALAAGGRRSGPAAAKAVAQVLVGSGSCSPVTAGQIAWARGHGFVEVPLHAGALAENKTFNGEIRRATNEVMVALGAGKSVIVHTTRRGAERRIATKLKGKTAQVLGAALGTVLRDALPGSSVRRLCIAGGDTASFAARALGIEALEMIARLTPGAPLCRAQAPGSPVDGREVVFKGGQVGGEDYFGFIRGGK